MDWWWVWSAVAMANRAAQMKACNENFLISFWLILHLITF